jgi:hypothetical protein
MHATALPQDARHSLPPALAALQQFVDDELLRAPLLFDQVVDGSIDALRKAMAAAGPVQRTALMDLSQALRQRRDTLSEYFLHSLREQTTQELQRSRLQPAHAAKPKPHGELALVDEEEVAVDVELAHCIETIRSVAEHELQELQTFVAALVGDMHMAHDHNPLRPETYARALWAAAHALKLSRGHQMLLMRQGSNPLGLALRLSCAAACARLEERGIEPASYRTLILPAGSRRGPRGMQTTFSPDLHGMRHTMPAAIDNDTTPARSTAATPKAVSVSSTAASTGSAATPATTPGRPAPSRAPMPWRELARSAATHAERQSLELVSRLFDAILEDGRVPPDMQSLIASLHPPALRLTLTDATMLDQDTHPLWRFLNRLAYEAEMAPDASDPERARLFKVAQATIDQILREPAPTASLFRWAQERLDTFLQQRLVRRLAALSTQVATLQKLEDKLCVGTSVPSTLNGTLDMSQLDTVPADLLAEPGADLSQAAAAAEAWLKTLKPGDWVRMFIQGSWVRAQMLWPGERHEIWLFGDGASDATWAVRRRALLAMHAGGLLKTLKQRSLVRSAAARLQQQLAPAGA